MSGTKIAVAAIQPAPFSLPPDSHVLAVLIGIDVLINALCGGRAYQTISSRIGESIMSGGWASKVPWPGFWVRHCEGAFYITEV